MRPLRHLILALTALILVVAACTTEQQVEKTVVSSAPAITIDADKLYAEYYRNSVAADQEYKGRVAIISGVVAFIGKELTGTPYIQMVGPIGGVQCSFSDDQIPNVAQVSPGQEITVKGKIDGFLLTVNVRGCTLQSSAAISPAPTVTQPSLAGPTSITPTVATSRPFPIGQIKPVTISPSTATAVTIPTPIPTPTPLAAPTPTAVPTRLPTPTMTLIPFPTSTPVPTATLVPPTPTPTPQPAVGLLAFLSEAQGRQGLYLSDKNGNNVIRFADAGSFTWSPDGDRLAFECQPTRNGTRICIGGVDGKGIGYFDAVGDSSNFVSPAWSPDGQRILYVSLGPYGVGAVSVMSADGVPQWPAPPVWEVGPGPNRLAWSPDGQRIAVVARGDIFVVSLTGVRRDGKLTLNEWSSVKVTQNVGPDSAFSWSPDGQWLAIVSSDGGEFDIFKVRPDGKDLTRLTNKLGVVSEYVAWSPDGQLIAFLLNTSNPGVRPADLYAIRADGTGLVRLTSHGEVAGDISWSPDSSLIAYWSWRRASGITDISVVNRDGSSAYDVTNDLAGNHMPIWQPGQVQR